MEETGRLVEYVVRSGASSAEGRNAFGMLVARFQDMAYGYAYARLGSRELAEDASQEAFLAAWSALPELRQPEAFPGWFRQILRTQCGRLERVRREEALPLEDAMQLPSDAKDPHDAAEGSELRDQVHAALASLPEHERTVMALFYIGEHSYNEITAFLELPLSTVKKRLHSARARLKERMIPMLENDLRENRPSGGDAFAERVRRMIEAAAGGDTAGVDALLRQDAGLANARGAYDKTPLHLAGEGNHTEIAGRLIAAGADLTPMTSWGMDPLEWAATMGNRETAETLLAAGVPPNLYSAAGLGMLHVVRSFWEPEGVLRMEPPQLLCTDRLEGTYRRTTSTEDAAAVVNEAFYVACRNGHTDAARVLLEKGADPDARGFFGGTGLHWAAINGHMETVHMLLGAGADPALKDERWESTPLGYAEEGKQEEIAALLRPLTAEA